MRSLNWNNITASGDGDFERLPAGAYVARITSMVDVPDREYVEVVYDIAEGPHAGYYGDEWGRKHPYAHHFFMSYKEKALGMLKGRLESIAASNPGFDPFAAWDAGRTELFVNRLVGINLQEEEYERNDGDVGTRLNVCQIVDAQRVRDGLVKPRERKALGGRSSKPASATAPAWDGEIPFD